MEAYNHIRIFYQHFAVTEKFTVQLCIRTIPIWISTNDLSVSMHSVQHMTVPGIHDYASHSSPSYLDRNHVDVGLFVTQQ